MPQFTDWIHQLSQAMLQTQCRKSGELIDLEQGFEAAAQELKDTGRRNGSIWWIGNGGSAAICSHLSQDVLNKLQIKSQPISDHSLLTCMANDFGYEEVYSRPLETLGEKGDLLIAISSSGNSANILNALKRAQEKGMRTLTLSAFKEDNALWNSPADVAFYLPTELYGQAESGHEALLHAVIEVAWLANKDSVEDL